MRMKRVLAVILLASLLLYAALPAAAEPPGDADTLRAFLQEHYGMTILMGSECSFYELPGYELKIKPQGSTPFLKLLAGNDRFTSLLLMMDDAFSVYPPAFFSGFRAAKYPDGLRFLLVDEITGNGIHYGGVQTTENKSLDIILSRSGVGEDSIHHELFHAMEARIRLTSPRAFAQWRNLNPKGFSYSQKDSALREEDQYAEPDDWFAREYSKTFEEEDRATVFESIMTKDEAWWSTRPHLQKKAQFLLKKIAAVFGELFPGE